jgi:DNA-binding NarL/FixJ family response regulator
MIGKVLPRALCDALIEDLALAVVVLDDRRVLYTNTSARLLSERLQRAHHTDLIVLLRDQADAATSDLQATARAVSLVTSADREPFYIHLRHMHVRGSGRVLIACIRELAPERDAVKRSYRLSDREAQVVDLVLRGYGNRDIAVALGIASTTAKKHLSSIFNKVGVDSRAQLISRLA